MYAVKVESITKEYRLGALQGLKERSLNLARRLMGRKIRKPAHFKALDDVSFFIEPGEVVGIIGSNGAGKSTLLKILAGITTATAGSVEVNGRLAPLIEVGAGFVQDFTGRENVYLNGAILGLPRKEIDQNFDEIVRFAEMEEFIDTPVKRYSSGMQVKLAFSVATSVEADILIVDEVLAVGDLAFQRKCFSRVEELIRAEDRTVLIVSHNIRQITRLCTRTILIDKGKVVADGDPVDVCNQYYERSNYRVMSQTQIKAPSRQTYRTSGEMELTDIRLFDENQNETEKIVAEARAIVKVRFKLHVHVTKPEIVIGIHTTDFVYLTSSSTSIFRDRPDLPAGSHEVMFDIPRFPLSPGVYCIKFILRDQNGVALFTGETLKVFSVSPSQKDFVETAPGERMFNLEADWHIDGQGPLRASTENATQVS